jgi:hypothetical protein
MQTFYRAAIEGRKAILPILNGISKSAIDERAPSLANYIMADIADGVVKVASAIGSVIARGAPSVASVPIYMETTHLFLSGTGEMFLHREGDVDGRRTTIWETVAYAPPETFPIFLDGKLYTRRHLAWLAAATYDVNPGLAESRLGSGIDRLKKVFDEYSIKPALASMYPFYDDDPNWWDEVHRDWWNDSIREMVTKTANRKRSRIVKRQDD